MTVQEAKILIFSAGTIALIVNLVLIGFNTVSLRYNDKMGKILREKTAELQGYIDHARDHPEVIPCTQGMTLMPGQMCSMQLEIHPGEDMPIREPEKPKGTGL